METTDKTIIKVEAFVKAPVEKVWQFWTLPQHIQKWNYASDDWHTPHAENDLRIGGKFLFRMETKDGKEGFDFTGVYDEIKPNELIAYKIGDGRKVIVEFTPIGTTTKIVESFLPENENSAEMQRVGWKSILDNFKKYVEEN
jgi:uncharacterized protein YndB with AHSA1/START domain